MSKKIKMLEADRDKNNKNIYDVDKEINTMQKDIPRRKQRDRKYRDFIRGLMS